MVVLLLVLMFTLLVLFVSTVGLINGFDSVMSRERSFLGITIGVLMILVSLLLPALPASLLVAILQ